MHHPGLSIIAVGRLQLIAGVLAENGTGRGSSLEQLLLQAVVTTGTVV